MKRILLVIISVSVMIAVASIFFVFHAKKPKSERVMNSLADVDVTQENISYEDLCAIVKVCTENGGCSVWDSTDGKTICICAESEKYQADKIFHFFIYQSADGENEWTLAGHGNLSSDPAGSAYWLNSSLKAFFGEDSRFNSAFLLEMFEQQGETYHW